MADNWTHDFGIDLDASVWPKDINLNVAYVEGVGVGEEILNVAGALGDKEAMVTFMHEMRKGYNDYVDGRQDTANQDPGYAAGVRIASHSRRFHEREVSLFLHGVLEKILKPAEIASHASLKLRLPAHHIGHRFDPSRRR